MREDKEILAEILMDWVHPKITVRANIDHSRMEARKPGFIVKAQDAINENKIFECEFKTLDEIYKFLLGSFVPDFNVWVESDAAQEE